MKSRTADDIFNDALELAASERASFLDWACASDESLRRDVESLIAAYEQSDQFMTVSAISVSRPGTCDERIEAESLLGETIGRYRIVEVIAVGGMGAVYLAERDNAEFEQRVAIKVIRRDVASPGMIRRFQNERQTLAGLEHAGITRLIDGDTTSDGLPYLVMELVDGVSIDQHCQSQRLTIEARLRLFLKACDAVQYAHGHLVIHRDLKPANVLVRPDGMVKLCDFGIAKLLDSNNAGAGWGETVGVFRLLTPQYASPEQIDGGLITTATDVYSLGAILYELLSGQPVHPAAADSSVAASRNGGRSEPVRPSSRLTPNAGYRSGSAVSSDASSVRVRRQLRGDLDTIVLKALRERPEERYASVEQFADDIRRYLDGMPVLARPQTIRYRAKKFVRRYRGQVIAIAVVITSLAATTAVTGRALFAARRAESLAQQRQKDAEAAGIKARRVGAFLQETLANANPLRHGGQTTLLDMLADATRRASTELAAEPAVAAEVYLTIGKTYGKLWKWSEAAEVLRTALALHRSVYSHDCEELADCLSWYGRALTFMSEESAVEIQREGLAIRTKIYPPDHPQVAESEGCLGYALWKIPSRCDVVEAEQHYQRALEIHRNCDGPPSLDHARMAFSFAVLLRGLGRTEESEKHFREAVAIYRSSKHADDRYMMACLDSFSAALESWGRPREAIKYANDAMQLIPDGADEDWRAAMLRRRGGLYLQIGGGRLAVADLREALVIDYRQFALDRDELRDFLPTAVAVLKGDAGLDEAEILGGQMIDLVAKNRPLGITGWLEQIENYSKALRAAGATRESDLWKRIVDKGRQSHTMIVQ